VVAEGEVADTPDGLTVRGSLTLNATSANPVRFTGANLRVQYGATGAVTGMSGTAVIPSPHERVEFANPVEADIGIFSGRYLNEQRELPILLKDDIDYFVYRVKAAYEMRLATGETGSDATKPIAVRAPLGGEILLIVDYTDPMYFTYGALDLLGAAGLGWSLNGRLPFKPEHQVNGLGAFDGTNTRAGTFPIYKVIEMSGQLVDNEVNEIHLSLADPLSSDLKKGYQAGINGTAALDLFFKDFLGIQLPLASASAGVFGEASIQSGLGAHAYLKGTSADFSWWPTFLPFKPAHQLSTEAFVTSAGDFTVELEGQYGWELPFGTAAMTGRFRLAPDSLGLTGGVVAGGETLELSGGVTSRATSIDIKPPASLISLVGSDVNARVEKEIEGAQAAWDSLQAATVAYELELSLRGLRQSLPQIVDLAKSQLRSRVSSALSGHSGTVYYSSLRSAVYGQRDAYIRELDALKAAALNIQDNSATRASIERALRRVAARKTMTVTYRHKVLGVTVKTVTVTAQVLTSAQATQLRNAADNVQHIKATSDRKITMQQIYDQVHAKALFEQVRSGTLRIPTVSSFGFEYLHQGSAFSVHAILGGKRESLGQVDVFDIPAMAAALAEKVWQAIN